MTLYMENSNEFIKILSQLIHKFSKIAGYKINIQIYKNKTQLYFYILAMNSLKNLKNNSSNSSIKKNKILKFNNKSTKVIF